MTTKSVKDLPYRMLHMEFSPEALGFLAETTGDVRHFDIYLHLLANMATGYTRFSKRGIDVPLSLHQVEASANSLASVFGLGRKAMTRILATMCQLGIIEWTLSKVTSIATVSSVCYCDEIAELDPSEAPALPDDMETAETVIDMSNIDEDEEENDKAREVVNDICESVGAVLNGTSDKLIHAVVKPEGVIDVYDYNTQRKITFSSGLLSRKPEE